MISTTPRHENHEVSRVRVSRCGSHDKRGCHEERDNLAALRSRIIARFTELETERTEINKRLAALDGATGQRDEPALLDALPMLGNILADESSLQPLSPAGGRSLHRWRG